MQSNIVRPDLSVLKRIRSLALFSDEQLARLAQKLEVKSANPKQRIIAAGGTGNYSLYLFEGRASSRDGNGNLNAVVAEADGFLQPLAQLRPSLYDIDALSKVSYLEIDNDLLGGFSRSLEAEQGSIEMSVIDQSEEANMLAIKFCMDMSAGTVKLPTMPDIVIKIQRAFADPNSDAAQIRMLIQSDPAISARLLRSANSPLYRGNAPVESLQQAIVRMGMETVQQQIMVIAASQIFQNNSADMKKRMQQLWQSSRRVAAFSRVLAQETKLFDAETAQLAGLLSDLGVVAIHQYVHGNSDFYEDEELLNLTVRNMRPMINGMLLQNWDMSDEVITVGEESHDWFRSDGEQLDLCDLVVVARYFSYIGTPEQRELPLLSKMPAFARLRKAGFKAQDSIAFIEQTRQEVETIEQMLGSI